MFLVSLLLVQVGVATLSLFHSLSFTSKVCLCIRVDTFKWVGNREENGYSEQQKIACSALFQK